MSEIKIGLKMLPPYPDKERWRKLLMTDPLTARLTVVALERKAATLGMAVTEDLKQSLPTYYVMTKDPHDLAE